MLISVRTNISGLSWDESSRNGETKRENKGRR